MLKQGPLSGQTLGGKYLLGDLLGKGGFGAVYQSENQMLHRQQAVKVLLEEHFSDEKFRDRFLREARTLGALDHANIVHVDDIGLEGDVIYLVMPYISGGTLQAILKSRSGPLGLDEITRYLEQICSALGYAHAQGVVHLDLKPLNLLVHKDGRLLLSDFGLAHLMEQGAVEGGTSLQFGSPLYMAPEHFDGKPGQSGDIYALGVILYQMLTGRHPFEGATPAMVMRRHLTEPPQPLRTVRPDLPPELEDVLAKALAKQPEQRYGHAGELLIDFKAALIGQPIRPGSGPFSGVSGPVSVSQPDLASTIHAAKLSGSSPQPAGMGSGPSVSASLQGMASGPATALSPSQPTPSQPSGEYRVVISQPTSSTPTPPPPGPTAIELAAALADSPTRVTDSHPPSTPRAPQLWTQQFLRVFLAAAGACFLLAVGTLILLAQRASISRGVFTTGDQSIVLVQCLLIAACLVALRFAHSWLLRAGLLLQAGSLLAMVISSVMALQAGATPGTGFSGLAFTHFELIASLLNAASLVCISYGIARWKFPLDAASVGVQVLLGVLGILALWKLSHFSGTAQDIELAAAFACDIVGAGALLLRPACWKGAPVITGVLLLSSLPFRLHVPYAFRIGAGLVFLRYLNISRIAPTTYGLLYGFFLASSFLLLLGLLVLIQQERLGGQVAEKGR